MNAKPVSELPDLQQFLKNRAHFPPEELRPYAGSYVAWNLEGTRILASACDEPTLHERLLALGIDPARVVGSYIDPLE
jgi:hypothetical protein